MTIFAGYPPRLEPEPPNGPPGAFGPLTEAAGQDMLDRQ